jgi:50S ribosomal protein L16 3-hydroxylase
MTVLGGMSARAFLRDHWQKEPLLVRRAVPGFEGILGRRELLALATRGDAISRLVIAHPPRGQRPRWERHDGPFAALEPSMLPASSWTLLVHGVESLVPGGWELLRRFSFIPSARVDDLMVSYAADGGSVGPHVDRYDVFLLQGPGRRRWQVNRGGSRALEPGAGIEVLAHFEPEEEWVLEPGDMLYLPPGVAHWGIAEGPCFTYSIGFLAPTHKALVQSFLGYLSGTLGEAQGEQAIYEDPDLAFPRDPLELDDVMVDRVAHVISRVRWDDELVAEFLGRFLTRPKPHVGFAPPSRPLSVDALGSRLRGRGRLVMALPSRGLVRGHRVFLNGEVHRVGATMLRVARQIFADRSIPLPLSLSHDALQVVHGWYVEGHVMIVRP